MILIPEYKFHDKRKWKFDWAIPELMIAIEQEGGAWSNGRHNRGQGFINDMEKYNAATIMGWKVLRYTPQQIQLNLHLRDIQIIKENNDKNKNR